MRDPELVAHAQRAAVRLESAWERWRALQGLGETPAQPVVGYVGYALKEPWGQPRAVIGFSAEEAERLAEFLERGTTDRASDLVQRHVPDQPATQLVPAGETPAAVAPAAVAPAAVAPAARPEFLAATSQLSGSQHRHRFLSGSSATLKNTGARAAPVRDRLDSGRPGPGPSPDFFLFLSGLHRVTGATWTVQYMHRDAVIGIVLRHSGQSLVVTSTALVNRAVIVAIGATMRK